MTERYYTTSTAFLEALAEAGVKYVFANLGSDHPGLIEALAIPASVPIIPCDARNRESTKATLVTLVEHAMSMQTAGRY